MLHSSFGQKHTLRFNTLSANDREKPNTFFIFGKQCNVLNSRESESRSTLCNPMDYTVHGRLEARKLEWVAFPFSRGSSQPKDQTQVPTLQVDYLPAEPQGKSNSHPLP